ncbi:MAG TPA: radical SAM protein [bacterium]|nr:radical SAM protein [bacterium]
MRVLFIHLGRENLGIEYLSSMLKNAGHEVDLAVDIGLFGLNDNIYYSPFLEARFSQRASIIEKYRRLEPDVVCFSAYSGTFKWCGGVAEDLKKIKDVPFIIGGSHITLAPEALAAVPAIDFGVRGEAESVITRIVEALGEGNEPSGVKGLVRRSGGGIVSDGVAPVVENLDELPFPDKKLFEHVLNIEDDYMTMHMRGCPFLCSYCCESEMRRIYKGSEFVRLRSVDSLMEELGMMKYRYRYREVFLSSALMPKSREWMRDFSRRYRKEINVPFWCFGFVGYFDREYARYLKEAGCGTVEFGVQTMNEANRRGMLNRPESNETVIEALKICDEAGLNYDIDFIMQLPGESEQDYVDAVKMCSGLKNVHRVKVFNLTLFPGAKIIDTVIERGLAGKDVSDSINMGESGDFFHVTEVESSIEKYKLKAYSNLLRIMPVISKKTALKILRDRNLKRFSKVPAPVIKLLEVFNLVRRRDLRFLLYLKLYARHVFLYVSGRRSA